MAYKKNNKLSKEAMEIKTISEQLKNLPLEKLMYIAGAVTALAVSDASLKAKPTDG